jgi:hypothetical protein
MFRVQKLPSLMFFLVLPLMDVSDVAMWCFISCFGTSAVYSFAPTDVLEVSGFCNVEPEHSLVVAVCVLCSVFSG